MSYPISLLESVQLSVIAALPWAVAIRPAGAVGVGHGLRRALDFDDQVIHGQRVFALALDGRAVGEADDDIPAVIHIAGGRRGLERRLGAQGECVPSRSRRPARARGPRSPGCRWHHP